MTKTKISKLYLPALKGNMGDWVYYTCLMPMSEVADRFAFASDIHPKTGLLSDLLQRELKNGRGKQIATYLKNEKQHLFNALVIAVYGGDPEWHEFGPISSRVPDIKIEDIPPSSLDCIGILSFNGAEQFFALDGQHRLAGIKLACKDSPAIGNEKLTVLFVGHQNTKTGLRRTRRLFTTLNKRAKVVSKGEIIALDEDDAVAITVRRLVEEHKYFDGDRIAYTPNTNIPVGNLKCLTTIGNLYDLLKVLFTQIESEHKLKVDELLYRPDDERLDALFEFAVNFFEKMAKAFPVLSTFFKAKNFEKVVEKYRGNFGGNILFRPIGLTIIVRTIAELTKSYSMDAAIEMASWLPQELNKPPLVDVIWDSGRTSMKKPANDVLLRNIYLYMLGINNRTDWLATKYAVAVGSPNDLTLFANNAIKIVE